MKKYISIYGLFALTFFSCKSSLKDNILIQKWTGPYGGVPAFDKMKVDDLKPAMLDALNKSLMHIQNIAEDTSTPTFDNTIIPFESASNELDRVFVYYGIWNSNISNDEFRKVQQELVPKISEYQSKIVQNEKLYQRIKSIYSSSVEGKDSLKPDQKRVVQLIYDYFVMRGADLNEAKKKQYAEINKTLSELYTKFSNNVLHDEENYVTYLTKSQLGGLPSSYIKTAEEIATQKGKKGMYAVLNTRSSMDPFLTFSDERELRKQVWTNYYSRGDNGDEYDNNEIIAKILKLRKEKANLLGHSNYASWRLQDRMAKTPENTMKLMNMIWPKAISAVEKEVYDMQKIANEEGHNIVIEPWDYRYYTEKVRTKKYDLNSDDIKKYLQLDKLKDALFFVAKKLFDFQFTSLKQGEVPVFQEDVKVWKVTNTKTGELVGLWYFDPYARQGKRSGAWATTYRDYTNYKGKKSVLCSNNCNYIKSAEGQPVLISWDDAKTLFHEFGHALHFLSANVRYPTLQSGVRDYTEFHSQLLERWLSTEEVINQFLINVETNEHIPEELIKKIKETSTFNQGFKTTEYLASAIMDMKLHLADPTNIDIDKFEKEELAKMNMPQQLPMRHRTPHFQHIFSSEGYAATYYGYLWADVITSDAAEAFAQAPGGFYDKEMANKAVKYLYAPRNAIDPEVAYRKFRGRDADIGALMRDRGFEIKE